MLCRRGPSERNGREDKKKKWRGVQVDKNAAVRCTKQSFFFHKEFHFQENKDDLKRLQKKSTQF